MPLLSQLKNALSKAVSSSGSPATPPSSASSSSTPPTLAQRVQGTSGHIAISGATGCGKSVLASQLARELPGCVVCLSASTDELAGWQEAPFHGEFFHADGQVQGMELEEALRTRPCGRLNLVFPWSALDGGGFKGKDALSALLREALTFDARQPLTLVLQDEPEVFVRQDVLDALHRQGRGAAIRLVYTAQQLSDQALAQSHYWFAGKTLDPSSLERLNACWPGAAAQAKGLKAGEFLMLPLVGAQSSNAAPTLVKAAIPPSAKS